MSSNQASKAVAWTFVLLFSGAAGLIFAGLTISGWIHGWEGPAALLILILAGLVIVRRRMQRPVLHSFAIGFLSALFAIELQAAFLPMYFANNPEYELVEIPFGLPARLATAVFAPVHATLAGLLTAGIAWVLCRLVSKGVNGTTA